MCKTETVTTTEDGQDGGDDRRQTLVLRLRGRALVEGAPPPDDDSGPSTPSIEERRDKAATAAERRARQQRFMVARQAIAAKLDELLQGQKTRMESHDAETAAEQARQERFGNAAFKMNMAAGQLLEGQSKRRQAVEAEQARQERFGNAAFKMNMAKDQLVEGQRKRRQAVEDEQARQERFGNAVFKMNMAKDQLLEGQRKREKAYAEEERQQRFANAYWAMLNASNMLVGGQMERAERIRRMQQARAALQPKAQMLLDKQRAGPQVDRRAQNFAAARNALQLHGPHGLGAPVQVPYNSTGNTYTTPGNRQTHIVHGDHTGGGHQGGLNLNAGGALPSQVTQQNLPGHHVSHFPAAWDADDIISALEEAADVTFHHAAQQGNGNWRHPAVRITRKRVTCSVVAITNNHMQVWTGWAS